MRLTRQLTFYRPNQTVIGTKKVGFEWTPIIPGAVEDNLYRRVCLPAAPPKIAEITRDRAVLRVLPDDAAPPLRLGKRGERFEVVPESGLGGWFNLVDPRTQDDYWLTGDDFKMIKTPSPDAPRTGGGKSSRTKTKPKPKPKKRKS